MALMTYDIIDMCLEENVWLKYFYNSRQGPSEIIKQRRQCGEFSTLYETLRLNEDKFHEYTGMTVATFDYLLNKIESRLQVTSTNFHVSDSISPAEKLIVTIRYLATGTSFRSLALSFRMGKTTIANIVYLTCSSIWMELVNVHMPHPTHEDLKKIASDYYRLWDFPMCIGSIDAKYCRVKCPAKSGSSHKNYFSIIQGIADTNNKFIAIEVGGKGKQRDEGTFLHSALNMLMENGQLDIPAPDIIPGTAIRLPYVLIADEAYPLKENIIRPFPSRNLDTRREYFNKRLSRARKCIECTFGILYAKWRILSKEIQTNAENARLVIKTTCLLHNIICDLEGCVADGNNYVTNIQSGITSNRRSKRNNSSTVIAKKIRQQFSDYFWENRINV